MDTNIISRDAEIRNFLDERIRAWGIGWAVARAVLDDDPEDVDEWFENFAQNGCISGWITSLIYYTDTHAFYDEHYNEIEEIRQDWEDQIWCPLETQGDLKNFYTWFAFEQTAWQMMEELGLG